MITKPTLLYHPPNSYGLYHVHQKFGISCGNPSMKVYQPSLLHRIHLTNSDICPRCNSDKELASHLLIHCPTAATSWNNLFNQLTNTSNTSHTHTFTLTPQTTISQILQQPTSTATISSFCFYSGPHGYPEMI